MTGRSAGQAAATSSLTCGERLRKQLLQGDDAATSSENAKRAGPQRGWCPAAAYPTACWREALRRQGRPHDAAERRSLRRRQGPHGRRWQRLPSAQHAASAQQAGRSPPPDEDFEDSNDACGTLRPLPQTLQKLDLSGTEMMPPPAPLPPKLRRLFTGIGFNNPLDEVPEALETLYLSTDFDQPLGRLPASLREMSMTQTSSSCAAFNQPLHDLPDAMQVLDPLDFDNFKQTLGVLPPRLVKLTLGSNFNRPLGALLQGLQELCFYDGNDPSNLNKLLGVLPASLRKLYLGSAFNQRLGQLPSSLEYLECIACNPPPLGPLPGSLQRLRIWESSFNRDLGDLPKSLIELRLHPPIMDEELRAADVMYDSATAASPGPGHRVFAWDMSAAADSGAV
ncbi:hypothetical protein JKP88DRAFT_265283 [Tribonema minus]|uniref:Uncharacterized protein n=1 Tax=Tribonema minus TaxID=303371 RepID=A0A835YK33_9STRA|nr:hypothetical protein JKP88DRAFT_265283 [Tribonema minus]